MERSGGHRISGTCHTVLYIVSVSLSTQMEVLHSSSFAYNCRVMETRLHREFKHSANRMWSYIGAGSYYLSEKAIQVHNRDICHLFVLTQCGMLQNQLDNALISKVFIVYAPLSVASSLFFRASLPMHAISHSLAIIPCDDDDLLPDFLCPSST
jgi:hypothetical protein